MRRKGLVALTLSLAICLCGCGSEPANYSEWIPDHSVGEVVKKAEEKEQFVYRNNIDGKNYSGPEKLTEKLLNKDADVADCLYRDQIINGASYDLSEAIDSKRTILYVSDSEGNDRNTGLSPEKPKKSLPPLSEFASVAILLKAGDTFPMDGYFYVGAETVIGSYGEGPRPILDFTKKIEEPFVKIRETENVWAVDLSKTDEGQSRDALNFGQLYIDGECNWNRYIVPAAEKDSINYGEFLEASGKNMWIADGTHGVLYLYCTEDPNTKEIRYSSSRTGLQLSIVNNVFVSDLDIRGISYDGISLRDCTDVVITNCRLKNIGGYVISGVSGRQGKGIVLSGTNRHVSIVNNYFEDIYAAGFSFGSLNVTDVDEDINISNNVFTHCYTGIEQFSDASCIVGTTQVKYDNNIFYEMCDVTNPDTPAYADAKGELIKKDLVYESFHYDNLYSYITCANLTNLFTDGELSFTNNVCWSSNRFLMRLCTDYGYPAMSGNFFYNEVPSDKVCLFDLRAEAQPTVYVGTLANPEDVEMFPVVVQTTEEEVPAISEEAKGYIISCFKRMLGK